MTRTIDSAGAPVFEFEVSVADMMEDWAIEFRRRRALLAYAKSGGAAAFVQLVASKPKGTFLPQFIDDAKEAVQMLKGERG